MSEPAISVRHMSGNSTVWTVEDLQNGIIDMRDVYEERRRIQEGVSVMMETTHHNGVVVWFVLVCYIMLYYVYKVGQE